MFALNLLPVSRCRDRASRNRFGSIGRIFLKRLIFLSCSLLLAASNARADTADTFVPYSRSSDVPRSVKELWSGFDATSEELETEIIREWKADGVTTRYVTFRIGRFRGATSRIAAYYSFPNSPGPHPAFVWSHGGGQRAERGRGVYFAKQGYATVDINWLGRPMEEGIQANTDWGRVDPTQGSRFYAKALRQSWKLNLEPDEYTIDPIRSPRNSNWFLLAVAGRRAISFLAEQEEVDPDRLGFSGYSMGGMVTALTAIDDRLKAVVPFVGGSGFKHIEFLGGIQGSSLRRQLHDGVELYRETIDASSYWPSVDIPVMFISSSNDFHSTFERIYRSMALLPHSNWRVSTNQHQNHGPGPEQWVMLNLWFDKYLKKLPIRIPRTPEIQFKLHHDHATLSVMADQEDSVKTLRVYYSHDPNSRTRFWESTELTRGAAGYEARIPIYSHLPTYAFAHCRYPLSQTVGLERGQTKAFGINSEVVEYLPDELDLARLKELAKTNVIVNQKQDIERNWSSRDGRTIKTYQLQSPYLRVHSESRMRFLIDPCGKRLALRLKVSGRFLDSRSTQGEYQTSKEIKGDYGSDAFQEVIVKASDFSGTDDQPMDWTKVATLEMTLIDLEKRIPIALGTSSGEHYLRRCELID